MRRLGVEDHRDLVARGVVEILDHQLAPAGGGRPVHLAQRLALLVLAHAVQVEAGRTPHREAPALVRLDPLGEDAFQLDQARVDEERAVGRQRLLDPLQAEGVVEDRAHVGERRSARAGGPGAR